MLHFPEMRGVIFDLDDTLLDNGPTDRPEQWLHSRSRLAAVHAVADAHDMPALRNLTAAENGRAFMTAPVHSLQSAIWNIFFMKGLVSRNEIDTASPFFPLVAEIAAKKNELHEVVIREYGVEVTGASCFIKRLAANGLASHMALATNAIQRDIKIFLDKYNLHEFFPPNRIISFEKVSRPKPDPQCFDLAFRSLGLSEEARPYVAGFEDNPRGIQSVKGAGLFACAITTRLSVDEMNALVIRPDLVANTYDEFADLLGVPDLGGTSA
jgi:beta-phosphoglucomutase-like phosphatase (HAD superfamily)